MLHHMKVTLEITRNGWKWEVLDGDKVVATSAMRRDPKGGYRGTDKAAVFAEALMYRRSLYDAIESEDVSGISDCLEFEEGDED